MDVHLGKPKLKKSGGEGHGEASGKHFGDSRPKNRGREARAAISEVHFPTAAKTFSQNRAQPSPQNAMEKQEI